MNLIQCAFYSPDLGEHFKYLLYGDLAYRKFFIANRSSETPSKSHFHHIFPLQKQLSATIKIQKSISSHVCANKKGLVRHAITLRTLLDAHDPKEVSESKQYDLTTHINVFHASEN